VDFEWLKYISPLLGVGLGIWLAPYVEKRKSKSESKEALNIFFSELEDYLQDIPSHVRELNSSYQKIKSYEQGQAAPSELILAPKVEFLTINNLIEKSFFQLTHDQRKAVKAILSLSQAINKKLSSLTNVVKMSDYFNKKQDFHTVIEMTASLYFVINELYHKKERFIYLDESNEARCQKALEALKVSLDF
jgi:hypothetical protein